MALKPTIYKARIALSDMEREYYDTLNLTIAQHPSETSERMMARLLAFCLHAEQNLRFTKGISTPDEPDIWSHSDDGQLLLWLDVGEPALDRLRKASRITKRVCVYSFNTKSDTWWQLGERDLAGLKVEVYQFPWISIQALAGLLERTMDMSVTVTGSSAYIATGAGECEVSWRQLQ